MIAAVPTRLLRAYRDGFSGLPRGVWLLALVCFVQRSGTMVLPFLALYLTSSRGFSTAEAGRALMLYGVGSGIGTLVVGQLTDRFGALRMMALTLTLAGVGLLVLGQLETRLAIVLAVPVVALVAEGFRPASSTAFTQQAPPERWSQAFALRRLAINLGMTCGPAVGGLLAAHDYRLLFVVDGATCFLAAAVLLIGAWATGAAAAPLRPIPVVKQAAPTTLRSPWADRPYLGLMACYFALSLVFLQLLSTYPIALRDLHGFTPPMVGSIFAINTILIVFCEMLLVKRLAHARPLVVAAWGSLLLGGGFALLPLGRGYLFVALTVVVWTIGEMTTLPFLETTAAARGEDATRGRYLGAYNFAFALGFGFAPLLGTAIYERVGPVAFWAGCGAVGVAIFAGLRLLAPVLAVRAPVLAVAGATVPATGATAEVVPLGGEGAR
jgi:predicted MFS family arabinose efflux permease